MSIFRKTTKLSLLLALLSVAGFFIYNSTAGTMKIITTGSSTAKINMPETSRLTSGLVGYWTFDGQDTNWTSATAGTVTDRSGNSNTGTLINMSRTTSPVPGINGQGLYFNNDDAIKDYVDVGNGSSLGLTGSMAISAWIKMNIPAGVEARIVIKGEPSPWGETLTPYNFGIDSASKLKFSTAAYEDVFVNTSTDSISLNQWQHVVVARNSSTQVTFYINSVQDSGGWQAHTPGENGGDNVLIGLGDFTLPVPGTNGRGVIDEVRIYNRALSANEITELYQQGQAKINASQAGKLTNGLVGHWTFDGQDTNWGTNTTNDRSGNSNNGTLTNMSTTTSPVPGVNGQALSFDGSNDKISVAPSASLNDLNPALTYSFWIKPAIDMGGGPAGTAGYGINQNFNPFITIQDEWDRIVASHSGLGDNYVGAPYSFEAGKWYHCVYTWSDATDTGTWYINSVLSDNEVDGRQTGTLNSDLNTKYIGTNGSSYFSGVIDEFRIYNRALSASEAQELYNQGR